METDNVNVQEPAPDAGLGPELPGEPGLPGAEQQQGAPQITPEGGEPQVPAAPQPGQIDELSRRVTQLSSDLEAANTYRQKTEQFFDKFAEASGEFHGKPTTTGEAQFDPGPTPAEIQVKLDSTDPNLKREGLDSYIDWRAKEGYAFAREQEGVKQNQSAAEQQEREQKQLQGLMAMEKNPKYAALAEHSKPQVKEILQMRHSNPEMFNKNWGWIDAVPPEMQFAILSATLLGMNTTQDQTRLKNFLALGDRTNAENAAAMGPGNSGMGGNAQPTPPGSETSGQLKTHSMVMGLRGELGEVQP